MTGNLLQGLKHGQELWPGAFTVVDANETAFKICFGRGEEPF